MKKKMMNKELDYSSLDRGIREVVRALRLSGFNTVDSGDGKSKFSSGDENQTCCALDVPNVFITPDQDVTPEFMYDETHRLKRWVRRRGIKDVEINLTYSPFDKVWIICLFGLDDKILAKAAKVKRMKRVTNG